MQKQRSVKKAGDLFSAGAMFIGGALMIVVLGWAVVLHQIASQESEAIESAKLANANLVRAFKEHVLRTIQVVDLQAMILAGEYEHNNRHIDLTAYQKLIRIALPYVLQVAVIDTSGYIVRSSLPHNRVYLGDSEAFRVHSRADTGKLFIGKPLKMHFERMSIPMSRRLSTANGAFAGVLVFLVDPEYFSRFFGAVSLGDNGGVTLYRDDGIVVARRAGQPRPIGTDLSKTPGFGLLKDEMRGSYVVRWNIDGIRRIVAFERFGDYPLTLTVATSVNEVLAPIRNAKPVYYLSTAAITVCLMLAGLVIARLFERQNRAGRALAESRDEAELHLKERQAALDELRVGEERFRDLAEMSSDWFWEQDASLRFTLMSTELYAKARVRPESTVGKLRWELPIVGVSDAQWRAHRAQLDRHEPFLDFVYRMVNETGEARWFSISGKPLFDERGAFRGYRGTGRDITESKRAEEALHIAEERNRSLLAASPDGVWIHCEGRIEYVNNALVRMLGYAGAEEIVGRSIYEFFPLDERDALRTRVIYTTTQHLPTPVTQTVMLRSDGSRIEVETTAASYRQLDKPWSLAIIRDVTERRHAEAQLRLAASVFDSATEGIMITDKDNNIVSVNRAFTDIVGHTPQEVLGRNPRMLGTDPQTQALFDEIWVAIAESGGWSGELRTRRKNGEPCWLSLSMQAIRNERRELIRHCAIFADITQRKAAEEELIRLNAELEDRIAQRTAELESFSYSVSHDLRSPLRAITGFSAIVLEKHERKLDAESASYLRRIWAAAERMALLIDDLLNLSRVSRQEMNRQDVDLSDQAGGIIHALAQAHPERKVEARVVPGIRVNADPGLLRILLENLIGNAWKFTSRTDGAKIEIGRGEEAGEAVYFVRDNGAGFDMQYAPKLFGAFQRLHTERDFEGTGIGLSIVQRIVKRHGGRVWGEGEEGKGATFHFTLG